MAWTKAELDELEANFRRGVQKVKFRDREVEYRSLAEMRDIIDQGRRELAGASKRHLYPVTQRGYQP